VVSVTAELLVYTKSVLDFRIGLCYLMLVSTACAMPVRKWKERRPQKIRNRIEC